MEPVESLRRLAEAALPLPGDQNLIAPLMVTRQCFRCARPEAHRQVWDSVWGRILLRCLRCGREVEAVVTGG
jgi:ribosomal protein S14